jgi:hypothetical protein
MKTLYQLVAKGKLVCFEGEFKMHSKKVFTSAEEAEKCIEDFKVACCDDTINPLYWCQKSSIKVFVIELELVE